MKKLLLILLAFSLPLVLYGCSPSLSLDVDPDPIVFTYEDRTEDVEITITTSGFGRVSVDSIDAAVIDDEDETVYTEEIEVDESSFIVSGISVSEEFTLDLEEILGDEFDEEIDEGTYQDEIKNSEYTLKIQLAGSVTTRVETDILFE